jgi:ATP-dependent helicase/DNAse subunit B
MMTEQVEEMDNQETLRIHDLEQEFIFHYFTTVNRMKEVMKEANIEMKIETYFRLLKRLTDTITIPFQGEPLSGLQIMGVLETRALDFDRLIILSMNEGVFPLKKAANSFIPYNLRRGFGLPTYEHQDSVWSYHFYRLIHRVNHVCMLYDTRNNGLQTGEVSRFVHQLHYHYQVPIQNKLVVYNVSSSKTPKLQIFKTEKVMNRLAVFLKNGGHAISASSINTYLDCPLKFYFSVVEDIKEEEEVNEIIESNVFGSILHKVMEILYKPFCGKIVTADLLKLIQKDTKMVTSAIEYAFAEVYLKTKTVRPLLGQHFLIGEMIRKYVGKVLDRDNQLTPFYYIESEKKMECLFQLTDQREIHLKGYIDRIDEVNGRVRIIDYKSGSGTTLFTTVENLFNREEKVRSKAVMQVFMYAWMYLQKKSEKTVQPGIYYMRDLFKTSFDPSIYRKIDRTKSEEVMDFEDYRFDFEENLRHCLDEIFSKETPFVQTNNQKTCSYCPFKDICGR